MLSRRVCFTGMIMAALLMSVLWGAMAEAEYTPALLIAEFSLDAPAPLPVASDSGRAFLPNRTAIDFPEALYFVASGQLNDGRAWRKYYFQDQSVNMAASSRAPAARYLVLITEGEVQELFLLFAQAGGAVLGGCYDEIYRRVSLEHDTSWKLRYEGATSVIVAITASRSAAGDCANPDEGDFLAFLYWDDSAGTFLTPSEWRELIHLQERAALNDDATLPDSVAQALANGFEMLPRRDSVYHQIDASLGEYEAGACVKCVHPNGREAIYVITATDVHDDSNLSGDPAATRLLTREDAPGRYCDIQPTFNYCPVGAQRHIASTLAHYYFDMLPYFWWGNGD